MLKHTNHFENILMPHTKNGFFYKNLGHYWKDELLVFVMVLEEVKVKVFWPYFVSNGQEKEKVKLLTDG